MTARRFSFSGIPVVYGSRPLLLIAVLFFCFVVCAADDDDTGTVFFSNGEKLEGRISTTAKQKLEFHDDSGTKHMLSVDDIAEFVFFPEKQEMEQKWFFPEAGKTMKEKYGEPYPVQHIRCRILLRDGLLLNGQLYSTVLLVRPQGGRQQRVVLKSKLRGKEGENFSDLTYPEQVVFPRKSSDGTAKAEPSVINVEEVPEGERIEAAALSIPDLLRLDVSLDGGSLAVGKSAGDCIAAVQGKDSITVFWPGAANDDKDLFAKFAGAIGDMADFFDERTLKSLYRPRPDTVYTLAFMNRRAKTSLHREESNPWRLIVQRWKFDPESGTVLLSAKGWLFRGIRNPSDTHDPVIAIHSAKQGER